MAHHPMRRLCSWGILGLIAFSMPARVLAGEAEEWAQWRGPSRDGILRHAAWPDGLGSDVLKLLWRVEMGPSYSGPIVVGDMIYTTETRNREEEVVYAFDRGTGKQVWTASWPGSMSVPFFAASNGSWMRSTPVHDGRSLYVAGMRDVLVCLDSRTGQERWRVDFVERYKSPLPAFGFACSPLVVGDHLYV